MRPGLIVISLVALFQSVSVLAMAADFEDFYIRPTCTDPLYGFQQWVEAWQFLWTQFRSGSYVSYSASEPISPSERKRLRRQRTHFLTVLESAEDSLLDDASLFRGVEIV